jgi:hypothetical protein
VMYRVDSVCVNDEALYSDEPVMNDLLTVVSLLSTHF